MVEVAGQLLLRRRIAHPHQQLELEGVAAEARETHLRARVRQHAGVHPRGVEQGGARRGDVRPVGDAHRHVYAHQRVAVAPVDQLGLQQLRVRHDDRDPVEGAQHGAATADPLDHAGELAEADEVARLHRPFQGDQHAADEVVGNVLQAEADADAQHAGQQRQRAEVEPGRPQHNHQAEAEQAVAQQRRRGRPGAAPRGPVARDRRQLSRPVSQVTTPHRATTAAPTQSRSTTE
ncbi:MAG: hypothetical protein U0802_01735 [Candidatus Binatia bacterium]